MKTLSLVIIVLMSLVGTGIALDNAKQRIDIVTRFVHDLKDNVPNVDVFRKYLRSEGSFANEKIAEAANGWTDVLRNSLKSSTSEEISIYQYSEHPEKGRKVKSIEDPDSDVVEYESLEFELHASNNTVSVVDQDNLFVIKIRDERIFVLFDEDDKMITYFGLKWGKKVELTEF